MSYQVDSYGNAYFPAGVSVASIPVTTGTQNKVLVPGPDGRISSASISQLITQSGGNLVSSVYGRTGAVVARQGDYNTDLVTEGQALYFTHSRARKSISVTTFNTSGPATYDSTTGIINIPQYGSGIVGNYVPVTRTITINGQTADLSANRIFSIDSMVYPSAGIPLSNGTSWGTSIVNNSANWNTAYGWGDHAGLYSLLGHTHTFASLTSIPTTLAGYGITDAATSAQGTNADTAYSWGNHALAGYLTLFTETDPIYTASTWYTTTNNATNWNTAYTWGNHALAGYLTSFTETDPVWTSEKANYALKTYVDTSISNLVDSAPTTLDTLNELAAALGDDANFSTTVTNLIGTKEPAITAGTTAQYWRGDKTWQTLPVYTLSGLGGEPAIAAGNTNQYWRGDKTWQVLPVYTLSGLGGVPSTRTLTINGTSYDLSANRSWTIAAGVSSFNTRTGDITLTSADVTGALGYTPYNSTNPSGYITGNQNITLSGDVTGSGATSIVTTIANNAVTTAKINNGAVTAAKLATFGAGEGIYWAANTDGASIIFESTGDGASGGRALSNLLIALTDNGDEGLKVTTTGAELLYVNTNQFQYKGSNVWTAASLTNLNQLTNGPGYITSYTETDTLASVTGRGASTSTAITISGIDSALKVQHDGTSTAWRGRLGSFNSTADKASFLGNYTGRPGVFGHNNALSAWAELYVNTLGVYGHGTLYLSWDTYVKGNGNDTNYNIWHSGNLSNLNQLSNGPGYITSSATTLTLTGNLTVSSGNTTGGGIILADDGDIVDLNDAYCSMRFSYGVRIYSANRGGTPVITLANTGAITANGPISASNISSSIIANYIVQRDANGYIYANHVNFNTSENENPTISSFITSNGDGWSRKSSLAHVKNSIRGVADGTWGINISGNAATASYSSLDFRHSDRDFPAGTLVQTSINYAVSSGDAFVLEIRGNSYFNTIPFDIQIQGYIYADTIISTGGYSNGKFIDGIRAINYNGNLCFWWPSGGYWEGFNVKVYSAFASFPSNRVTSITNSSQPTTAKQVNFTPVQSLHSGNYNSYSPTLTGGNASGTWGINITGSASTLSNNATISGLNFGGVLALTGSGASTGNSTGARLSESYGPIWNLSNGATWHHQVINGSYLCGISAGGGNYGNGNYYGTGDVTAYYSDERLKTKISTITDAIEKIKSLEGFVYVENELARSLGYTNEKEQAGVSAQQIQAVLPQAVSLAPFDMQGVPETGEVISKTGENYLTVKYDRIVPLLIEGIKEQQKQIEELKNEIKELKNK